MKRIIALILVAVMALSTVSIPGAYETRVKAAETQSLLQTHSFELDQNGWVGRGDASALVSDIRAQEGSKSLLVTGRTANWQGGQVNALAFLELNKTYELSTYVWFDGAEGTTDTFKLSVQKVVDGTMGWDTVNQVEVLANTWTEIKGSYNLTTSGDVTEFTVYVESADISHSYYVDNFTVLGEWSGQTFDFENGIQGFQPRIGEEVLTSEGPGHTGDKSLKIASRVNTYSGAKYNLLNKMQVGKTYNVEAWLYQNSGSDQSISLTMEKTTDTTAYEYITGGIIPSGTWTKISGVYTLNATTDLTALSLYFEAATASLDFQVDDMIISMEDNSLPASIQSDIPSIKDVYANKFSFGAAVPDSIFSTQVMQDLTIKHFSSITAENSMKPESMLSTTTRGAIDFTTADQYEAYTKANNMGLRGHTLIWHSQTPDWFFTENYEDLASDQSNLVSREVMLARMENYIKTVTEHYNNTSLYAWDVVNEAIDTSQPDNMRRSLWYKTVGPDFVEKAFEYARKYSDAKLFYNDYGVNEPNKRTAIATLIAGLQTKGLIDGVGIQSHISMDSPSVAGFESTINVFENMGLEIHLTELDMDIYANDSLSYTSISEEMLIKQGYRFKALFEMFANHSNSITNITVWGLTDNASWLNSFPINRKNWPLLFDKNYQAKYAYWGIVDPSKLPIMTKEYAARNAVLDLNVKETLADRIQTSLSIEKDGGVAGKVKLHWDSEYLYLTADMNDTIVNGEDSLTLAYVDGSLKTVKFYRDGRVEVDGVAVSHNGNEKNMKLYPTSTSLVKARIAEENTSYRIYAAIPMSDLIKGKAITMDMIANDGITQNHWNDITSAMPLNQGNFGKITLVDGIRTTESKKGTPVVDGSMDSIWQYANKVSVDQFTLGTEGSTGTAYTMWDKEFLYVLINVLDSNRSKVNGNPWEQDSVEVFIDENHNRTSDFQLDDNQYRINFDNEVTISGGQVNSKFSSATTLTSTGYIVEMAIPYNLGEKKQGDLIGFDLQINNDNGSGSRTSVTNWNDKTGNGWRSTAEFGALLFVNDNAKATPVTSNSNSNSNTSSNSNSNNGTIKKDNQIKIENDSLPQSGLVKSFVDVPAVSWFFKSIELLRSKGILSGNVDGSFKPGKSISKGEVAKVLVKALNLTLTDEMAIPGEKWYAKYGNLMTTLKLMDQGAEASFNGDSSVTREEMAVILYKSRSYLKLTPVEKPVTFMDEGLVTKEALEAVRFMAANGIFQGNEKGKFMPDRLLTRSEIAVIIERLIKE